MTRYHMSFTECVMVLLVSLIVSAIGIYLIVSGNAAPLTCYEATGDLRIVTIQWNDRAERFTAYCLDFDTETVTPCALAEVACPEEQGE